MYVLTEHNRLSSKISQNKRKAPNLESTFSSTEHSSITHYLSACHSCANGIKVSNIRFSGQSLYNERRVQAQVSGNLKSEMSFIELRAIAQKVTDSYHKSGYMTAVAYLPTQDIVNGTVMISILGGHNTKISYDNTSKLRTKCAESFAHLARPGRIIRRQYLDRLLPIMNDVPGIRAHAFLSPGEKTGTAATRCKLTATEVDGGILFTQTIM